MIADAQGIVGGEESGEEVEEVEEVEDEIEEVEEVVENVENVEDDAAPPATEETIYDARQDFLDKAHECSTAESKHMLAAAEASILHKVLSKEDIGTQEWEDAHDEWARADKVDKMNHAKFEKAKKDKNAAFGNWVKEVERFKNIDVNGDEPQWFESALDIIHTMSSRGIMLIISGIGRMYKSTFLLKLEREEAETLNAFRITLQQGWPKTMGAAFKLVSELLFDLAESKKYDITRSALGCFDMSRNEDFPPYFFALLEKLKNASSITKQVTGSGPKTIHIPPDPFKFVVCMNKRVSQEEVETLSFDRLNAYVISEDGMLHLDKSVEGMKQKSAKRQKTLQDSFMENAEPVRGPVGCSTEAEFEDILSKSTVAGRYKFRIPKFSTIGGKRKANLISEDGTEFSRDIATITSSNIAKRLRNDVYEINRSRSQMMT